MSYQHVKGMPDILPAEMPYWHLLERKARLVFERASYREVRTPVAEPLELFERSVGESTDIVQKEMYAFTDRKERKLVLRPEGTASAVRAFVQHGLDRSAKFTKWYYLGPMFRYERPQKGRQRQFHQLGAEVLGSNDPLVDVELIETLWSYLEALGLRNLSLELNSLGDQDCRERFAEALQQFLKDKMDRFCPDCQRRQKSNPLRMFDCKVKECKKILEKSPVIVDYLNDDAKTHLETIQATLKDFGREFVFNPRMARGFDYYTRTVFEFTTNDLGAQNAVAGGGRYNNLVEELGGKPTPAVGFAMGLERAILLLKEQLGEQRTDIPVFVIYHGEAAKAEAFKLVCRMRRNNIPCDMNFEASSVKAQFRQADAAGASFAMILGDDEIAKGEVSLKDLRSGTQITKPMRATLDILAGKLMEANIAPAAR